ncbi:MAG: hypothetical protein WBM36_10320 [Lysobacterales bacterium]
MATIATTVMAIMMDNIAMPAIMSVTTTTTVSIQSTTAMAIDITRKIITMPVAIHITVVIATIGIHAVM